MSADSAARPPPPSVKPSVVPDVVLFALLAAALGAVILQGAGVMGYHWQWYRVPGFFGRTIDDEFIPGPLLRGLQVTAQIVLWSIPITLAAGLLTALLRLSRSWAGQAGQSLERFGDSGAG